MTPLDEIKQFLRCETGDKWTRSALQSQHIMLIDHANCEKKAAGTALALMYKYIDNAELLHKMSQLAREELRHFEQVLDIMTARDVEYVHVSASRYAAGLRKLIRPQEPYKLIDTLIIGAYIEARSCERFAKLAPHLDPELGKFYTSLLKSEARHFKDYLELAKKAAGDASIEGRIALIGEAEKALILEPDTEFRFHSGPPSL